MEKCATSKYGHYNEDFQLRYIHKYYLPLELRTRISPADIDGIRHCFKDESDVREEQLAEKPSDCVITYKDIGMEKRIDGATAHQVLMAYMAYRDDRRAELTPEENQAAINLNNWLIDWEKQLLAKCIQLSEAMERQVRSDDSWLTDYEIDVTVDIYVREDDPFSPENMPDSWENDVDSDSSFLCRLKYLCNYPISAEEAAKEDYWGIGDSVDHNDRRSFSDAPVNQIRHCDTFHELYDHLHFPMKHMGRIGYVSTDIIVRHQNGISVDLRGEHAVAERDEPRIRKNFVLSGLTSLTKVAT